MTKLRDYHTITGWRSEQDMWDELQRNHAEAEYFAHVEGPATHDYPRAGQTAIVLGNELILEDAPF